MDYKSCDTIVPCPECRQHIDSHVRSRPITHEKNIGRWIWNLHGYVNERLGKPKVLPMRQWSFQREVYILFGRNTQIVYLNQSRWGICLERIYQNTHDIYFYGRDFLDFSINSLHTIGFSISSVGIIPWTIPNISVGLIPHDL